MGFIGQKHANKNMILKFLLLMTLAGKKNHNLFFPLRVNYCYQDESVFFAIKKKLPAILYVGNIIYERSN